MGSCMSLTRDDLVSSIQNNKVPNTIQNNSIPLIELLNIIDYNKQRPEYKSMKQLIKSTKFTGNYTSEFDISEFDYDFEPKYYPPTFHKNNDYNSLQVFISKNDLIFKRNRDIEPEAFDERNLKKIRKYIYKYRMIPEAIANIYLNVGVNGPCGNLKEITKEEHLNNFEDYDNSYQMANNFFTQRCAIYLSEAMDYQLRKFSWNRDEFVKYCKELWSILDNKLILYEINKDLINIIKEYVKVKRVMKTACPKVWFVWIGDKNGKIKTTNTCYMKTSYDAWRN